MPVQIVILLSTRTNEEGMPKNQLHITFEGPRVGEDGLAVGDLQKTLTHVQRALRLMVGHLMGADPSRQRKPSNLVRDHSALRLVHTSPGSFVTVLELSPPPGTQHDLTNCGPRAVSQLLNWGGDQDRSLPQRVAEELMAVRNELSEEIDLIRLRDPDTDRSLTLTRMSRVRDRATSEEVDATLQGRLMMVDWKRRTAQLHSDGQPSVRLRFDASLDEEMQRLARKYVEVRGRGRFDQDGNWADVRAERVTETPSWSEPFDLDRLLNDPPKIFDPEKVVRASDPIDVDQFMRTIREGRDA
ncbi:MAG: hypothetical protein OXJ90_22555 [Spirochaetaceae bacterium]|nr:hypothetical protein [Spirochaetaceae bacterium]